MPKVEPKEKHVLLYEDKLKYDIDTRSYNDLKTTINNLSIELETRVKKPLKHELETIVQSKDINLAVEEFITNHYNRPGGQLNLSYKKIVELMELDLVKLYQLVDNIKSRRSLIFKAPQIEQYRYYARTPEQIRRFNKLSKMVEQINDIFQENKTALNNRFLPSFAIGSSNTLTTNGTDLKPNYKWVLNGK